MKKYRNEWKYHCSQTELATVEHHIRTVLSPDPHARSDGRYTVHSLYFDDMYDACANDTLAGLDARCKYRIRYYDDRPDVLHLERKEKLDGVCRKVSCPLTREEYDALVSGEVSPLLYETQKPLLRHFCTVMLTRRFTPRVIISYERTAYVEPISNIRVTIDASISASRQFDRFLSGDYLRIPLMHKDEHVLEVKFDAILPGYVRRSVNQISLCQQTFSKYVLGFETLRSLT